MREAAMPRVRFGGHTHLVMQDGEYIVGTCCRRAMLGRLAYPGMDNAIGAVEGERLLGAVPVDCPDCLVVMRDPAVNT